MQDYVRSEIFKRYAKGVFLVVMNSRHEEIKGIIPPIITSFDEDGNVSEDGQRALISFLNDYVHGYWVCGSYGSFPLLTKEERKNVLEIVVDEADDDKYIIANVGSPEPSLSVELGLHAKDLGVDALGSVAPFYHQHREVDIKYYFQILKSKVDYPIYFYNNPSTTGYSLNPSFFNELIEEDLVDGIKDSGFDILLFYDLIRKSKELREKKEKEFNFIIGTESIMVPALINGAAGSIAGIANCIPEDCVECYNSLVDGNLEKAVELQNRILEERDLSHLAPSTPAVQKILELRGLDVGYPRPPFQEPDEETVKKMEEGLKELDIGKIK